MAPVAEVSQGEKLFEISKLWKARALQLDIDCFPAGPKLALWQVELEFPEFWLGSGVLECPIALALPWQDLTLSDLKGYPKKKGFDIVFCTSMPGKAGHREK